MMSCVCRSPPDTFITSLSRSPKRQTPIKFLLQLQAGQSCRARMSPPTYRHSFHKALVPEEVYEKTMQAIFNGTRGQPYDTDFILRFIKEQLTQSVAILKQEDSAIMKRFFLQHVALESFYHLGKRG